MKGVDTTTAKEVKTTAAVFELPQRLGILQHVEHKPPRGWWKRRLSLRGCVDGGGLSQRDVREV
jgi:hypothetical protein